MDKREIKRNYKQMLRQMGVYQIRNVVNGKIFIGSSKNIPAKFNSHQFTLEIGSHINRKLQDEYKQFGKENFVFEILELVKPKEDPAYDYSYDIKALEKVWLEKLSPFNERGYN